MAWSRLAGGHGWKPFHKSAERAPVVGSVLEKAVRPHMVGALWPQPNTRPVIPASAGPLSFEGPAGLEDSLDPAATDIAMLVESEAAFR